MSVEPLDHNDNADSAWVLAPAVSNLAAVRCPVFDTTDALAVLHATASLLRQGREFVADLVDIQSHPNKTAALVDATQLEVAPAVAQRRYRSR